MSHEVTSQQLLRYAAQSEIRVRSGAKLVGALLIVGAAAAAFGVWWLASICGAGAAFLALVTAAEHWNARRKRRRAASLERLEKGNAAAA